MAATRVQLMQQTPELNQNKVRQVNEQLPFQILPCSEGSAVTLMHITPFFLVLVQAPGWKYSFFFGRV